MNITQKATHGTWPKIWKNNGLGSSWFAFGEDQVVGIDDSGEPKKDIIFINFCV
jgi:hypothetical protein